MNLLTKKTAARSLAFLFAVLIYGALVHAPRQDVAWLSDSGVRGVLVLIFCGLGWFALGVFERKRPANRKDGNAK